MKKIVALTMMLGLFVSCEKSTQLEDAMPDVMPEAGLSLKSASTDLAVPDDYPTIQEAVNAAEDGATITIKEGIYRELVFIYDKHNLTLLGENATLCPSDDIIHGEGSFNIEAYLSSNIKIMNLIFDGKPEGKTFPIDRAINFVFASGEASYNTISGYSAGIACYAHTEVPYLNPDEMMSVLLTHNRIKDCYGSSIIIIGSYNAVISQNVLSFSSKHTPTFSDYFSPDYAGIDMHGGTGIISKNNIRAQEESDISLYSAGIRLMKTSTNPDIMNLIVDLHDMEVIKNIIHGTDTGISLNSEEDFASEWSVSGLSLQYNKFIKVEEPYLIFNNDVPVEILP